MTDEKQFPEGMVPLGKSRFAFRCHAELSCFTTCCRNVDMLLYPYDLIRLKRKLNIRSDELLEKHVKVVQGDNPFFPTLMMKMTDDNACPFLGDEGCTVYEDRPAVCRMYPLERAVDRTSDKGRASEYYFLTDHSYCKGHGEAAEWSVKEWIRDQQLLFYNAQADQWAEMDTIFSTNPWAGEGAAGPRQRLAFMVCYNIDSFRDYVVKHDLLSNFKLSSARRRSVEGDDEALLNFGYDWLKMMLTGQPVLRVRKR